MKTAHRNYGFSLVEVMIASVIMGMLLAGVVSFYMLSLKSMYASDQRMKLAAQINKFSNELVVQGSRSNQFILYKSATPADFDGPNPNFFNPVPSPGATDATNPLGDRQTMVAVPSSASLSPAGDFVVFVYFQFPKLIGDQFHRIAKLEGYYLDAPDADGIGTVKKVVIDLSAAPVMLDSTTSIESILTAKWNTAAATYTTYFPLVRGLAVPQALDNQAASGTPTARLFYMSAARNVIITGQIYSSRKDINTKDWKTNTNAFCFNITPRT